MAQRASRRLYYPRRRNQWRDCAREAEAADRRRVIVPTIPELGNALKNWPGPEFSDVLADTTLVFKGTYFQVYKRRAVHQR